MALDLGDLEYRVRVDTSGLDRAERRMGDYTDNTQQATRANEKLGNEARDAGKKSQRATQKMERGSEKATSSFGKLSQSLGGIQTVLATVAGSAIFGNVVNQIATFEETLNGLRAVSSATASQMAELEEQSRTLGATTRYSADQTAQGQRFLAQAGLEVNEIMSATPGILNLATAGQLELAEAADIASNVLGGMRLEVSELNRVNDVLAATASGSNTNIRQLGNALSFAAPFAASAGISIEEAAAAIGTMSDAGIQASRAGTGMVGFVRQLSNITPDAASALQDLGLSTADVNIESLGLQKVLDNLSETSMTTEQAIRIFGSEAGAASQVIVNASDRVGEFSEELRNAEGEADAMAAIMGQGLANSMRGFGSALSESILQLGDGGLGGGLEAVIDSASGVLSVYNGMLPEFVEANDISSTQSGIMQGLATALASAAGGAGLLAVAYGGLTTATRILTAAQWLYNAALSANPIGATIAVVGALAGALWSLRDVTVTIGDETATVGEVISATWQEVTQGLLTAWEEITGPINNLIDSIGEQFGNTSGESVDVWGAAMDGIVFGAKTAVNTLIGVFVGLADSIAQIINNIAWNFETLWTGVADAAQSAFSGDFSGAAEALNRELINPLENVGRRFSEGLFRDYVGELGTAVSETISAGQTFKTLDQWLMEVGSTSAQASESIRGATSATNQAGEAAEAAAKAAAKFDKSLNSLLDTLFPAQAAARQYQQQQMLLQTALMSGRIEADKYFDALKRLEEAQLSQQAPGQAYGGMGFGSQIGSRQQGMGGEQEQDPFQKWLESARTAFSDFDQMQANVAQNFQTQFGNAFEKVIFDSQNLGDAFQNLAQSMLRSIVNAIGQMIAQWIAYQAVQLALGQSSQAAAAAGAAATGTSIAAAYAPAAAMASLASFGANAVPASAAISSTMALSQGMALSGMAHDGITDVPKEGTWLLDKGERVVDSQTNSDLKSYLSSGGRSSSPASDSSGGTGDIIIQVSPQVQPGATEKDGERYGRGVGNEIKSIVRQVIANEMAPRGMLRNVKGP